MPCYICRLLCYASQRTQEQLSDACCGDDSNHFSGWVWWTLTCISALLVWHRHSPRHPPAGCQELSHFRKGLLVPLRYRGPNTVMPAGCFGGMLAAKMRDFPHSLSLSKFPASQIYRKKYFQKHIFWSQIPLPQIPNSYYLKLITLSVLLLFLAWCSEVVRALYIPGSPGEIRALLSKIIRLVSFKRGLTALPHSQSYRVTEIWLQ